MTIDTTNAERQARHRAKQAARFTELEAEVKRLRAKLALRAPEPVTTADTAKYEARIAELERKLALVHMAAGKVPETVAEMDAMRRIGEEMDAARRARAKAARQAKVTVDAAETLETLAEKLRQTQQQLKGAQTRIRNLKAENVTIMRHKTIAISKELLRTIRGKILHPDTATDPKERNRLTRLFQEFNSFTFVTPDDGD
jgi:uncharacterized coiled-coil DUF342 family protein